MRRVSRFRPSSLEAIFTLHIAACEGVSEADADNLDIQEGDQIDLVVPAQAASEPHDHDSVREVCQ